MARTADFAPTGRAAYLAWIDRKIDVCCFSIKAAERQRTQAPARWPGEAGFPKRCPAQAPGTFP